MTALLRDITAAVRQLVKQPTFTAVVVVTLGLGIGPNTAIFSVVNTVLMRPLPYEKPARLALIRIDLSGLERHPGLTRAEIADFRERSETLAQVGAVTRELTVSLTEEGNMEAVLAASVTPNLFPLLGIDPALGRHFTEEEEQPGAEPVVLLSHELFQRRYAEDASVIGNTLEVGGRAIPIVGVMPRGFQLHLGPGTSLSPKVELWMPLSIDPTDRGFWAYRTIVRLEDGVSFAQAGLEIQTIGAQLESEHPEYQNADIRFYLHPLREDLVAAIRPAILTLLGAVGLVLLIACTNAASLLLARMKARERELAVRSALGAGRGQLLRRALIESLMLGLLAGAFGMALGMAGLELLLRLQPANLPRLGDISLNPTVLAFTLAASLAASLLFGIVPAWQQSRPDLQEALKQGRRSGGGVRNRTRSTLVVAQVAFSLILLFGAGLMIRTFLNLRRVDLGFEPGHVLTFTAALDGQVHDTPAKQFQLFDSILRGVRAVPGVEAAGGISLAPLGNQGMMASYSADADTGSDWTGESADYRFVLPGYFESMGVTLLAGRLFENYDNEEIRGVAVVDHTLAQSLWPGESVVGRQMTIGLGTQLGNQDQGQNGDDSGDGDGDSDSDQHQVQIVGVVEHSRIIDVREVVRPQVYLPYRLGPSHQLTLTVRTSNDPLLSVPAMREQIERAGAGRPIHTVRPMTAYVNDAMGDTQFTLTLMSLLAGIALILSALGIYSVIAYLVRYRTHETGIRLALGAQRGDIVRMNVKEGVLLAAVGIPIGLGCVLALTRLVEGLLYEVKPTDPTVLVGIALLLLVVAGVASWVPGIQASRVDPMIALRDG